ncbi:MAG: HAD family hydrolase [Bdellovibrionaceae bacterium]|nr:HAD family hydrolase [Pseudobdellovibrionaceae bacterium]
MTPAVFFDRDDTLIVDRIYLNDPDQIEYLPDSDTCLKAVMDAGYKIVLVTNQSGVAKGIVDPKNLDEIHRRIDQHYKALGIEICDFLSAPYLTTSDHYYRKPQPGMLREAAEAHGLDLKKSWMVGDRMSDVEAGHRAGCRTILLSDKESPEDSPFAGPEHHVHSLLEVRDAILQAAN